MLSTARTASSLLQRLPRLQQLSRALTRTMSTFIHLHTLDLRTHDSPSLHLAHHPSSNLSSSIAHFLPVYIIDSRQLDITSLPNSTSAPPAPSGPTESEKQGVPSNPNHRPTKTRNSPRSRVCQFHRTSPHRLSFLLQAIYSLRETYRQNGGNMLIGYGKPEVLIPALVKALKKDGGKVEGVWAQNEITVEEEQMLFRLEDALKEQGVKLGLHESKTMIPVDQLPFEVKRTPDVYTSFRKKVEGLGLEVGGGMLVEPLKTAEWSTSGGKVGEVKIGELRSAPKLNLTDIHLPEGQGGWVGKGSDIDSVQGMYAKLSQPLVDAPPIGGWSIASNGSSLPELHKSSAIPFEGGEGAALSRLEGYVGHGEGEKWHGGGPARTYKDTRNGLVGDGFSTKFASFLSLGCLSAREAGWRVAQLLERAGKDKAMWNNVYWILFELLWRDFFQYTTSKYASFKRSSLFDPVGFSEQISSYPSSERPKPEEWHDPDWSDENDPARKWCEGRTGVPFIDANMRELRETGYMSNRGRQNVASFLVKDLYVDWRVGAEFFEMHLVDYDTCSNWGNWQYQAGVGNDPRSSRQFNPIKQANDYDKNNEYVRLWVPELKDVGDEHVQTPWVLNNPSKLGGYPYKPIVEQQSWRKFYHAEGGGRRGHGSHGHPDRGGGGGGGSRGHGRGGGRGGRGGRRD